MSLFQLNAASGGINRQRVKGGPKPDNLYDILNGYVDASGAVQSRPGTEQRYDLPVGTIGMCAFNGGLVVFASAPIESPMPEGVACEVLTHPEVAEAVPLRAIHYAGPFLGSLFVTAEFADGRVFDFWLESAATWVAERHYQPGDLVQPSVPNGYAYRATRIGEPGVPWAPNVERAVGDVVEPTVPNGYEYVVVEAYGLPPRSGAVEPSWATQPGAATIEEADVAVVGGTPAPPSSSVPPRYTNPGGSAPGGGRDSGDSANQVIR